jgi:hypothetical protein
MLSDRQRDERRLIARALTACAVAVLFIVAATNGIGGEATNVGGAPDISLVGR